MIILPEMDLAKRCSAPVALIVFNRPDLTERVFEAIRRARPRQLFVIADGPRDESDKERCAECRAIARKVDWDCKVHTNFSDTNLGCGRRPATGIDWVFSQVEQAIILEDDCLASASFFRYCEQLLERYRGDERVMHISGSNFLAPPPATPYSYYFSRYTFNWGWATWRRAWRFYDYELKSWPQFKAEGMLGSMCPDRVEAAYWESKWDPIYERKRDDAWDYQWTYAVWSQGGLSILPSVNLVTNIGCREDATHTGESDRRANLPAGEITEIVHPSFVVAQPDWDRRAFDEVLGGDRLRRRRTLSYQLSKPVRLYRKWRAGRR